MSVFFECFDTNSDAKFERSEIFVAKNENFDEMTRFDVENDENIEVENVKNEIDDRVFDCKACFKLSIEKIIDSNDVVEKIEELEINFDFFT